MRHLSETPSTFRGQNLRETVDGAGPSARYSGAIYADQIEICRASRFGERFLNRWLLPPVSRRVAKYQLTYKKGK